jgi:hypothetical protein
MHRSVANTVDVAYGLPPRISGNKGRTVMNLNKHGTAKKRVLARTVGKELSEAEMSCVAGAGSGSTRPVAGTEDATDTDYS